MSAVTIQQLVAFCGGGSLTVQEEAEAQIVLDGLQGEMEAWLGRPIEVRSFTEDYQWTGEADLLRFRNTPVATVASVSSVTVGASSETISLIGADFYTVTSFGLEGLISSVPSPWPYLLRVAYTGGFDISLTKYSGIRFAILKAGRRWWNSRGEGGAESLSGGGAIKSLSVEGYSVTFANGGGPLSADAGSFYEGELAPLKRFRRRMNG